MSRRMPMAPMTFPFELRSAEAFRLVGMTSPEALRGLRRALRVTPFSTTSRRAAVNSRVSSGLMKRDSDCSTTSSWRKPSSCETASLAWRILPSRSETNTGSGALAMMMSAPSERSGRPSSWSPETTPLRCGIADAWKGFSTVNSSRFAMGLRGATEQSQLFDALLLYRTLREGSKVQAARVATAGHSNQLRGGLFRHRPHLPDALERPCGGYPRKWRD